jgi:hypothetical protein
VVVGIPSGHAANICLVTWFSTGERAVSPQCAAVNRVALARQRDLSEWRRKLKAKIGYPTRGLSSWDGALASYPTSLEHAARTILALTGFDPARGTDEQLSQIKAHIKPREGGQYLSLVTRADLARLCAAYQRELADDLENDEHIGVDRSAEPSEWSNVRRYRREWARTERQRALEYARVAARRSRTFALISRPNVSRIGLSRRTSGRSARPRVRTASRISGACARSPSSRPGDDDPHDLVLARGGAA